MKCFALTWQKDKDLRNNNIPLKKNKATFYGTESISSSALKFWNLISQPIKDETELSQFKTKINSWTISQCQ